MKQTRMIFLIVIKKFVKRVLNARMHQDSVSAGWYFCVGQARRHTPARNACIHEVPTDPKGAMPSPALHRVLLLWWPVQRGPRSARAR